jgi:uncharacterized membrane protein
MTKARTRIKPVRIWICHRIPERSFFWRGRQFPVCARCTGVFAGYVASGILFFFYAPPVIVLFYGCAAMFFDWLCQYVEIAASTNPRRLVTGIIGGYCLMTLGLSLIRLIWHSLSQ